MSVTMNDSLVLRDENERRTESALTPAQHLLVRRGDIAYNMMRMWQGACGLAEADGVVSPAYVVLAPKDGIDSRFAYYWFKSARMIHLFWAYSHGLTSDRLRLYYDEFAEIPVAPPPLDQQHRIVAVLDAWDQAIAETERLIAAKRRRRAALISRLVFTRRQAQDHTCTRAIKFKSLGTLFRGVTYSPEDVMQCSAGDHVLVLTAGNIQDGEASWTSDETRVVRHRAQADQLLRQGDYMLSMSNGSRSLVGKAGLVDRHSSVPIAPGAFCAVFRPNDAIAGLRAQLLFQSEGYREQLHIALAGSSINNLTNTEFEEFTFHVGAEFFDLSAANYNAIDADVRALKRWARSLRAQKRGLMQKLLTGEWPLDARVDSESATARRRKLVGAVT